MATDHRSQLREIRTFRQLVAYLRDEMGWPIGSENFEDLTFDYTPGELGIDASNAAKIQEIKRLRPLSPSQPWGVFFVKFEPKRLPVVALRRILGQVALKKRASANKADRQAWKADDLLFVSNYGEGTERRISFAHFSKRQDRHDLPTLKVLGWDNLDTPLHLDDVAEKLTQDLAWPDNDSDADSWRESWRAAFTLRHREIITTSKELSIRLAELARAICDRIRTALAIETESGPLTKLMKAFQEALVHDLNVPGFADMYAQTIAYGLLSARIADPEMKTTDDFTSHMRTNPFLKELMETFLRVGGRRGKVGIDFDELGVSEVVELLDDANMEAVVRDFGDRNPQEDPVIHFYEHFLSAYDKKQKMHRGVFYTPRPVVSYIVRSVDELLRTEFGLEDGLADKTTWSEMAKRHKELQIPDGVSPDQAFVQILDPATGTGTFLVEAIDLIHKTLVEKWKVKNHGEKKIIALWNEYVPKHLLPRLHGYELLMAPYAIAHLKIGLKLYETGYRFRSEERVRVYLTNALEPAMGSEKQLQFQEFLPALAHEAYAVNEIKRKQRFTVVIGNPPYSYESVNSGQWITSLLSDYFHADGKPLKERNPRGLQDDYVKFLRLAQFSIDQAGVGIAGLITNHGFLSNPTFRGMRQNLSRSFNKLFAYDLHGNANRDERAPDGTLDGNVFDILQGVSILCARRGFSMRDPSSVTHADLFGTRQLKYDELIGATVGKTHYRKCSPSSPYYLFVFREVSLESEYSMALSVTDIFGLSSVGISTSRDSLCVKFTPNEILETVEKFALLPEPQAREQFGLGPDVAEWSIDLAQKDLKQSKIRKSLIAPVFYRPFDVRFTYYTGNSRGFHSRPRHEVMRHMLSGGNLGLCTNRQVNGDFRHVFATRNIADGNSVSLASRERTYLFPLYLMSQNQPTGQLVFDPRSKHANLQPAFLKTVAETLQLPTSKNDMPRGLTPEDIFHYVYAVLHSPGYRARYVEFLKIDFPRIPLPGSFDLFRDLSRLGSEIVGFHLMESPKLDHFIATYSGPKNPEVRRVGWSDSTIWIDAGKTSAREGHLATNPGKIGFLGVPEEVWGFRFGGYQVCHKWLKDRKGRNLSKNDLSHYQKIIAALNETIRIMRKIDSVIDKHGGWPDAFTTGYL